MKRSSWITSVDLKSKDRCSHKRKAREIGNNAEMEAESGRLEGNDVVPSQGSHQLEKVRNGIFPRASGGSLWREPLGQHLDF